MSKLTIEKISNTEYNIKFNDIVLGQALMDVDGYLYFWDNKALTGCTEAWVLRQIADLLDGLNKEWDEEINKYFEAEKTREREDNQWEF